MVFIQVLPDLNCTLVQRISHEKAVGCKQKMAVDKTYYNNVRMFPVITRSIIRGGINVIIAFVQY